MDDNIPIPALPRAGATAVPAKPRVWTVFVAFCVALVLGLIATLVIIDVVAIIKDQVDAPLRIRAAAAYSPAVFMGCVACTMFIFAGIAFAGAGFSPVRWRDRLGLHHVPLRLPVLVTSTLGIISMGLILTACINLGWAPPSPALEAFGHMIKNLSLSRTFFAGLFLGLLPGLAEELLFRGYIQTRLVARWGDMWGVFWTALMFGMSHLDLMQGLYAVAVGCMLGIITVRSGSIVPAMICHAANNLFSTLAGCSIQGRMNNLALFFIGLIILLLAIFYLWRRLPRPYRIPISSSKT
jgi:uncharacterized protein